MVSDEKLVQQACSGDFDAFLILYNRYLKNVYNRIKCQVPTYAIEQITQEVFISVIHSLTYPITVKSFEEYLYSMVNLQISNFYQTHKEENKSNPLADDMLSTRSQRIYNTTSIQRALQELPNNFQEIILLRFADGLTLAQIAEAKGYSLESTKSLYRQAIQELGKISCEQQSITR